MPVAVIPPLFLQYQIDFSRLDLHLQCRQLPTVAGTMDTDTVTDPKQGAMHAALNIVAVIIEKLILCPVEAHPHMGTVVFVGPELAILPDDKTGKANRFNLEALAARVAQFIFPANVK